MSVKVKEVTVVNESIYAARFVGCLVLTHDNKILLQQRGHDWVSYPEYLCEFGGHIEPDEKPPQAVIRELHEELGAQAEEKDIISLGAITEAMSNYSELIYCYFWHDKQDTITGCYEGEPKYFNYLDNILSYPKITDGLRWMSDECKKRKLLK